MNLQDLARTFLLFGAILAGLGVVLLLAPTVPWVGRLPGDILIKRPGFTVYFPLASCLLVSLLISLLWRLFNRKP